MAGAQARPCERKAPFRSPPSGYSWVGHRGTSAAASHSSAPTGSGYGEPNRRVLSRAAPHPPFATGVPKRRGSRTRRDAVAAKLLRPHRECRAALRHGAASLLLSQGVHPRVVMQMLGHSTIALTMNTYSHVIPQLERDAADVMENALRRPLESAG